MAAAAAAEKEEEEEKSSCEGASERRVVSYRIASYLGWRETLHLSRYRIVPGAVIADAKISPSLAERGGLMSSRFAVGRETADDDDEDNARQHEEAILEDRQHVEGAQLELPGESVRGGPTHCHR